MRILVGAFGHESNTFTPFLTTLDDFFARWGVETLQGMSLRGSFGGIVDVLRLHADVELVPSVTAWAMPGGVVARDAYERFKAGILDAAHDADGVCLALHGAMRAEGLDYCEDDLLADLHARVGPGVPMTVALDMHANLIRGTMSYLDALVAYKTAPHDDTFETGQKAAEMLMQILKNGIRPAIGFAKIPFLLPGEMAQTSLDPMKAMMDLVAEVERVPGVLSASLMNGHCWADVPDIGVIAVVVTDGDHALGEAQALAQREADRIASTFWARRGDFAVSAEAYGIEEAIEKALAAPESTVFLSDSGDNPGAGGSTDVPVLLEALLARGATSVLYAGMWDKGAVEACVAAGVGREIALEIGGKLDVRHGTPLRVPGVVRSLFDGVWVRGGLRQPMGRTLPGPIAVLNVGGIDIVLTSTRHSFEDPVQLRVLGLEPLDYRIVVLKRGYLTTEFAQIAPRSILAFTPGCTNCRVAEMDFRRVSRPMYPLDMAATWSPQE
jgi:microcystin degradation protein MlrC